MSVEPSTRTTRQAVDHFAGEDKRESMTAGLLVFCEESTEDWQYISGLETLGEPEPSTFAVLSAFFYRDDSEALGSRVWREARQTYSS